jgi:SAM-dependent methyltransferase
VIQKLVELLGLSVPLARVLDLGCGTGNSTRALAEIARQVVGCDASRDMLSVAACDKCIDYVESLAETLPFADASFGLITVSSAFHWFDRERFLPEAKRVLRPGGWLAVYTTGFSGTMRENPAFERWHRETYRNRYPGPPRRSQRLTDDEAIRFGFARVARDRVAYDLSLTIDEFVGWLTTHSNVVVAVERGTESLADLEAWLRASLRPLFPSSGGTFPFESTITAFQKPWMGTDALPWTAGPVSSA